MDDARRTITIKLSPYIIGRTMADPTYIACPRCGEPYAMTPMQKRLFHGRTLACQRCAKPFTVTEQTPEPVPARSVQPWRMAGEAETPAAAAAATANGGAATGAADAAADGVEAAVTEHPVARALPDPARTRRTGDGLTAKQMAVLIAIVLVVVSVGLYFVFAPTIGRAREAGRRATCAGNLQQIGMALQIYANGSGGSFPDTLDALVLDGTIVPDMLVCPSSGHTVAPGKTQVEQVANLASGRHQSYVYLGKGLTLTSGRQVLAYEPPAHHGGGGLNVLFSDGTVQFLPTATAQTAIPQLAATTQPAGAVAVPAQAPQTQPAGAGGTQGVATPAWR